MSKFIEKISHSYPISGGIIELCKSGDKFMVGDRWIWLYKSYAFDDAKMFFNVCEFIEADIFAAKKIIASEIHNAKKFQFPRFGDHRRIYIVERVDKLMRGLRPVQCGDITQWRPA